MTTPVAKPLETSLVNDAPGLELSSNQTSLSFERTRMSADRTLMSMVRTSLSLISFGFTIYTVFQKLAETTALPINEEAPRNFGMALILIGITLLVLGIRSHMHFQRNLTARHERLFEMRLVRHSAHYRATPTFAVAAALLFVGVAAFAMIVFNMLR